MGYIFTVKEDKPPGIFYLVATYDQKKLMITSRWKGITQHVCVCIYQKLHFLQLFLHLFTSGHSFMPLNFMFMLLCFPGIPKYLKDAKIQYLLIFLSDSLWNPLKNSDMTPWNLFFFVAMLGTSLACPKSTYQYQVPKS